MQNRSLFFLSIFFLILTATSCQSKRQQVEKEQAVNEQAHDLIDKQKYDEAIELLTPRHQQNPDNIEYALILATAYAGKAGVHVEEIWGFTLGYETPYFKINNFDNEESLKKYQIL
ncbi:MAG: hypothetical protein ACOYOK_08180, partial [Pseudobdellovibrionaceae bacterium]